MERDGCRGIWRERTEGDSGHRAGAWQRSAVQRDTAGYERAARGNIVGQGYAGRDIAGVAYFHCISDGISNQEAGEGTPLLTGVMMGA